MKRILLATCLLLGSCGGAETLQILRSDDEGMVIKAGSATDPVQIATVHCQNLGRLMQPIRREAISSKQMIYYYGCL